MSFSKKEYDIKYRKQNKKQFNVDLNIDEHTELVNLLEKKKLSKVQFIRNAIKHLKEEE